MNSNFKILLSDWIIEQIFSYYLTHGLLPDCINAPKLQIRFKNLSLYYLSQHFIYSNQFNWSSLFRLSLFEDIFFSIDLSVLFLKSFERKVFDKCFYNFLSFSSTLSFLNFKPKNPTWHCVTVIYEKQQIFCGLAKKGENYSQKPMPKLFSTVFSCSPRTVFSGVKRQKVKLQLTVTVLSSQCINWTVRP